MNRRRLIDKIVKIAIFSAIASVLYRFPKFSLPFFPSFLEINFANLPLVLAGFILGPIGGSCAVLLKTLISLPTTSTGCVGELADLLISLSVVISTSLIYKKYHTKKGAIVGLILGTFAWIGVACFCNGTFLIKFYSNFYAGYGGFNAIVSMCQKVIPSITKSNFMTMYLVYAVIPFNLLLSACCMIVTFLVYKRISFLFQKEFVKENKDTSKN